MSKFTQNDANLVWFQYSSIFALRFNFGTYSISTQSYNLNICAFTSPKVTFGYEWK